MGLTDTLGKLAVCAGFLVVYFFLTGSEDVIQDTFTMLIIIMISFAVFGVIARDQQKKGAARV